MVPGTGAGRCQDWHSAAFELWRRHSSAPCEHPIIMLQMSKISGGISNLLVKVEPPAPLQAVAVKVRGGELQAPLRARRHCGRLAAAMECGDCHVMGVLGVQMYRWRPGLARPDPGSSYMPTYDVSGCVGSYKLRVLPACADACLLWTMPPTPGRCLARWDGDGGLRFHQPGVGLEGAAGTAPTGASWGGCGWLRTCGT